MLAKQFFLLASPIRIFYSSIGGPIRTHFNFISLVIFNDVLLLYFGGFQFQQTLKARSILKASFKS
jgi:hypothetical protein